MQKFTTCLMFVGEQHGKAKEAINQVSLFKNSKIVRLERYGPGGKYARVADRYGVSWQLITAK